MRQQSQKTVGGTVCSRSLKVSINNDLDATTTILPRIENLWTRPTWTEAFKCRTLLLKLLTTVPTLLFAVSLREITNDEAIDRKSTATDSAVVVAIILKTSSSSKRSTVSMVISGLERNVDDGYRKRERESNSTCFLARIPTGNTERYIFNVFFCFRRAGKCTSVVDQLFTAARATLPPTPAPALYGARWNRAIKKGCRLNVSPSTFYFYGEAITLASTTTTTIVPGLFFLSFFLLLVYSSAPLKCRRWKNKQKQTK